MSEQEFFEMETEEGRWTAAATDLGRRLVSRRGRDIDPIKERALQFALDGVGSHLEADVAVERARAFEGYLRGVQHFDEPASAQVAEAPEQGLATNAPQGDDTSQTPAQASVSREVNQSAGPVDFQGQAVDEFCDPNTMPELQQRSYLRPLE